MSDGIVKPAPLRPTKVVRASLSIYRRHWWRLILSAIAVFTPLAIADGLLEEVHSDRALAEIGLQVASGTLHLVGAVFYAGLVTAAVLAWRSGAEHEGPLRVARSLPWRTVSVLDLLIPLVIVVGLLLLIVPGVLAAVYLSLAPAFAEIDRTGVRESMRRSVRAVRGSFWRVVVVYLVLVVLSGAIAQLLRDQVDGTIISIVVVVATQAVLAPFYGLASATVALDRRDADPSLAEA